MTCTRRPRSSSNSRNHRPPGNQGLGIGPHLDEEVDVTVRPGIPTCHRAKHAHACHAVPASQPEYAVPVSSQSFDAGRALVIRDASESCYNLARNCLSLGLPSHDSALSSCRTIRRVRIHPTSTCEYESPSPTPRH